MTSDILKYRRFTDVVAASREIPERVKSYYVKWLNKYLHFCDQNRIPPEAQESVLAFGRSLRKMELPEYQLRQAYHAALIYASINDSKGRDSRPSSPQAEPVSSRPLQVKPERDVRSPAPSGPVGLAGLAHLEWRKLCGEMEYVLRHRNCSPRTAQAYVGWAKQLSRYVLSKRPGDLDSADIKGFLSHLTIERKASAATQRQAFNAVLFLFRHGLKRELVDVSGVPRPKMGKSLPRSLSREDVAALLSGLTGEMRVIAELLYGCGLRLNEVLRLKICDVDLAEGRLEIFRAKGQKTRFVPLPTKVRPALTAQLSSAESLHMRACCLPEYAGIQQPDYRLPESSTQGLRNWRMHWVFPSKGLIQTDGYLRRYHVHPTSVQRAIREATFRAGITAKVSCHALRHSYANHLLDSGMDIRTVQALLGHSSLKTTLIYLRGRPMGETPRSPLDFLTSNP